LEADTAVQQARFQLLVAPLQRALAGNQQGIAHLGVGLIAAAARTRLRQVAANIFIPS